MMSAQEVITSVKQGKCDPTWRVYRGRSESGDEGCAILGGIGGFILLLFFAASVLSGSSSMGLFFLFTAIPCIIAACIYRKKARSDEGSFMVLLPMGIVVCYAGDPNNNSWLYFPSIYSIELAQQTEIGGFDGDIGSRTDYWLDVYGIDGSYRKCVIDDCFGDTGYICKTIIAAYNHYRRYNPFW